MLTKCSSEKKGFCLQICGKKQLFKAFSVSDHQKPPLYNFLIHLTPRLDVQYTAEIP